MQTEELRFVHKPLLEKRLKSAGTFLSEYSLALHFAKGKRKYKGMYQYMYQNFASLLPKKHEYLNFEQDTGVLALKIAKSSYHPDNMFKKFRLRVNA